MDQNSSTRNPLKLILITVVFTAFVLAITPTQTLGGCPYSGLGVITCLCEDGSKETYTDNARFLEARKNPSSCCFYKTTTINIQKTQSSTQTGNLVVTPSYYETPKTGNLGAVTGIAGNDKSTPHFEPAPLQLSQDEFQALTVISSKSPYLTTSLRLYAYNILHQDSPIQLVNPETIKSDKGFTITSINSNPKPMKQLRYTLSIKDLIYLNLFSFI